MPGTSSPAAGRHRRRHRAPSARGTGGFVHEGSDEAVAALGKRLDEAGMVGGVAERLAQPPDRRVQVVLEIDEDVGRPEPALELLAGDDLTGMLEQGGEHLERLVAQPDADAALEEQTGRQVDREVAEAKDRGARFVRRVS